MEALNIDVRLLELFHNTSAVRSDLDYFHTVFIHFRLGNCFQVLVAPHEFCMVFNRFQLIV